MGRTNKDIGPSTLRRLHCEVSWSNAYKIKKKLREERACTMRIIPNCIWLYLQRTSMPRALSVWFSPHPSRWQQEREINLDCSIAYLMKSFSAFLSSLAFAYIRVEDDAKETRRKIKWVPRPQVRNRAGSGAISHQYLKHSKMNLFIKNKQKKQKNRTETSSKFDQWSNIIRSSGSQR